MAETPIRFVVIGSPGHGKSTVLNEFAENDLFEVGSGGHSCTQIGDGWTARNSQQIVINDGKTDHTLILEDTPGFPDPNPTKAAAYYDHVVAKCNEPINGVLFILKPERELCDILERYAVLLREFVNLEVPLVILANGTEPGKKKRENDAAYEERRKEGLRNFRDFARTIEDKAQLHAREILVSYTMDDLTALAKDVLWVFASSTPAPSHLKSFADMERLLNEATNVEEAAKQKVIYEQRRIEKCQQDIAALQEEIESLKKWAAGTCWIPFAGLISTAIIMAKAAAKTDRIKELYIKIGDAEGAKRAAGDLEQMKQETQFMQRTFAALKKYLQS